ncbi:alpha/beta fold hydrolase [Nonomuraea sp. NPDC050310]|uniref:alpha/beta fold hydrolase n=1 Tax=Nonomuraea sp. NPDC050310 TaxID=3154935 RepID=UPI0033D8A277
MKQAVRFAYTPRGRVAYSVVGSGPPLVYLLGWVSHLGLVWDVPAHRGFVEALARRYTVIRYDKLGSGLSDRGRAEFTLESELEVLGALIGQLGLKRYSLFGSCEGGQVAAAHAVRHPDAVASLLLYGSCARGEDLAPEPVRQSILSLIGAHWGMGSRVLADVWLPGASAELTDAFARLQRAAATAETAAALLDMFYRIDVRHLLSEVQAPTLVMHRRGSRAVPFELGRELASLIPGAQFVALEGRMQPIYAEGFEGAASTILAFLGDQGGVRPASGGGGLTEREVQVVDLIAEGLTNASIARVLGVSVRTVDAHVEHVRAKLGVRSRAQMAVWASEQRLSRR